MFGFKVISAGHSEENPPISNGFIRLLATESARLGPGSPFALPPEVEGISVRNRYAPMQRLLARDDELFLSQQGALDAAKRLRRAHRGCYFDYVDHLAREIRTARRLRTVAMASQENWSFWILLEHTVLTESSLCYLRWLGYRHALGTTVAARDVRECLDFLLVAPKFAVATT